MRRLARALLLALTTSSCGRDVAQTAFRESTPSCEEPVTALPETPSFAIGALESTPLSSTNYGAGEGPGLWLVARDAYRVYLNGVAIAESQSVRSADFIPLSLLPGDNALSVVVWAERGTPVALLQLDELTQSYPSDAAWRVSRAPATGFAERHFDDSAWLAASDYGRIGALPGCDPAVDFLPGSLARWIGPDAQSGSSAVLRRVIRIAPEGFGAAATGGGETAPVLAQSWEELEALASEPDTAATILIPEGEYDFRRPAADTTERAVCPSFCAEEPSKEQFRILVNGEVCDVPTVLKPLNERRLRVASNKTIVGLGRGARLRGVTLDLAAQTNVVVRNLAVFDVNRGLLEAGDAVSMAGASDVWLDHLTAKWISDGMSDISAGSSNLTFSWMHYDGARPDACRGRHTQATRISDASATMHHCFYDHTESQAPLVDQLMARVHVYDNLVQDDASYGVGAACGAQVLLEATTFKDVSTPTVRRPCADDSSLGRISAPEGSNLYLADVGEHSGGDGGEPHDAVFQPPYAYSLEPAESAWPKVLTRAGAGGPWALPLVLKP